MDLTTFVIALLAAGAGLLAGILLGEQRALRRHADLRSELRGLSASAVADSSGQVFAMADATFKATENVVAPVRESLTALAERLDGLQRHEEAWCAQLREQVSSV